MRLLIPILASPLLLLSSCCEPGAQTSAQSASESSDQPAAPANWNVQNVNPASAQKLLAANKNVQVLDVRTPEEYAEGHIAGAVNVDFKAADFADKVAQLDKSKSYVVHCRSGNRSGKSLPILKDKGFGTIYHLDKGFNAWTEAGMPSAR